MFQHIPSKYLLPSTNGPFPSLPTACFCSRYFPFPQYPTVLFSNLSFPQSHAHSRASFLLCSTISSMKFRHISYLRKNHSIPLSPISFNMIFVQIHPHSKSHDFIFSYGQVLFHCYLYRIFFIQYLFLDIWVIYYFAIVNSAIKNTGVQISFLFYFTFFLFSCFLNKII